MRTRPAHHLTGVRKHDVRYSSRNARPEKDLVRRAQESLSQPPRWSWVIRKEKATEGGLVGPLCSRNSHDRAVAVRRAQ